MTGTARTRLSRAEPVLQGALRICGLIVSPPRVGEALTCIVLALVMPFGGLAVDIVVMAWLLVCAVARLRGH